MKNLIALFVLLITGVSSNAQKQADQIWSRVEALTKAIFEQKDSVALVGLLSNRVSYGHSGGNVEDKQLMIKNAVGNSATYKGVSLERVSVQLYKKTAVVRHNLRAVSFDKGSESPLNLHVLQVWNKEDGVWKLTARQSVKINPK